MSKRRRRKKVRRKNLIEVHTNKHGWVTVQLLKITNGRVIIKLPSKEGVSRKMNRIHWAPTYKVHKPH